MQTVISNRLDWALAYQKAGLQVIPVRNKSLPAIKWQQPEYLQPTENQLEQWFSQDKIDGIALRCGKLSGNFEVLDIEFEEVYNDLIKLIEPTELFQIIEQMPLVQTPRGGRHLYYRLQSVPLGSKKLARKPSTSIVDPEPILLIETRSEGSYILAPGSAAECHPLKKEYLLIRGDINSIPVLTDHQHAQLMNLAKKFDQMPDKSTQPELHTRTAVEDDYNATANLDELLEAHGFKLLRREAGEGYWRKPNSSDHNQHHVTTNCGGTNKIRCFSSACDPFKENTTYTAFEAYCALNVKGWKEALNDLQAKGYGAWGDPQPLESELLPVPSMTANMVPASIRNWAVDTAERMQAPIEALAVPLIVVVSSVIGAGCRMKPKRLDDWTVVPNLWGGIVGRPGKIMKSPTLSAATKALRLLERMARDEHMEAHHEFKADQVVFKRDQSELKNLKDRSEIKKQFMELEEPTEPVLRRYQTNDATIEKMNELLSANTRGLLYFRDELTGFLANLEKEGRQGDRSYYLEAWNGDGTRTDDRIGRGTVTAPNLCMSILGGTQPAKLLEHLHRCTNGLENDGLLQRFQLLIYPDPLNWQYVDKAPDKKAQEQVETILTRLAEMDFIIEAGSDDDFCMSFDEPAQQFFVEWFTNLHRRMDREEGMMEEHLCKFKSLMPSLALIFHLMEIATDARPAGPVSLDAAQLAAEWCNFLEQHARRIYGMVSGIAIKSARNLLAKIKNGEVKDGFAARDVYRKGWALLGEPKLALAACEELTDRGWLREESTESSFQQKSKTIYRINPIAFKTNS